MFLTRRPLSILSVAFVVLVVGACGAGLVDARAADQAEMDAVGRMLELMAGDRVADVGAGDGDWSIELAQRVGTQGRVFATEVTDGKVKAIEKRARRRVLSQIEVHRGDQATTGLPAGCCNKMLVRMVYHHFHDPAAMRRSLAAALRPGALVLVIDTAPQKNWGDVDGDLDRGGHGIPIEQLRHEMTSNGFEVVEEVAPWSGPDGDPFAVLFRWPG